EEMSEAGPPLFRAFFEELRRLGFREGETLAVHRSSGHDESDIATLAGAAVASWPDVIFAMGVGVIGPALLAETSTIPIVGFGGDFVRFGLVASLARPGGNLTGFTTDGGLEMVGKQLQLLRDSVPGARRIAYIERQESWQTVEPFARAAAAQLGVEV